MITPGIPVPDAAPLAPGVNQPITPNPMQQIMKQRLAAALLQNRGGSSPTQGLATLANGYLSGMMLKP